jgi:hypothetical protein
MPIKIEIGPGPLFAFAVIWLMLIGSIPASAEEVFSSLGPGDMYDNSNGTEIEGPGSVLPQALAEQFQPLASFYLESVDLALSSSNAGTGLRVEVYKDSGGIPGSLLEVSQVGNFTNGIVSADFGGSVILTGGTNYWLGLSAEGTSLFTWHDSQSPEFAWQAVTENEGTSWLSFSSDPFPGAAYRINGTSVAPPDVSLIGTGQAWRYIPGLEQPSLGTAWTTTTFDDSLWNFGLEGFGYDDDPATQAGLLSNVATKLSGMRDNGVNADAHTSLYLRREFTVVDPLELSDLVLQLDYDDSFIAYINGIEVARSAFGTIGIPELFDALGSEHESTNGDPNLSLQRFVIDLVDGFPGLLTAGASNVLSIQGLNSALDDDDFALSQISLGGNWFPSSDTFGGDFDQDGDVDSDDLTDLVDGWATRFGVDLNGGNFLDWQRQFGINGAPFSAAHAVPEPSIWVLLMGLIAVGIIASRPPA